MKQPVAIQDPQQPVILAQLAWTQHLVADSLRMLLSYIEIRDDEALKRQGADLIEKLHGHAERLESAALKPEPNPSIDW